MSVRTDVEGYAEDLWSFYVMGRVADENTFNVYLVCKLDETALSTVQKTFNVLSRIDKC